MTDPSLEGYVRDARLAGHADTQIRFDLKAVGWADEAISEALGAQPLGVGGAGEPPIPQAPADKALANIWSGARRGLIIKGLIGVGAVAVIGLGGYFGWQYYDTLPAKALTDMPEKMAEVKSASYKFQFKIRVTPASQQTALHDEKPPLLSPAAIMQAVGSVIAKGEPQHLAQVNPSGMPQALPPELKDAELDFRMSGAYALASSTNPAFSALLDFNVKAQGKNYAFSAEVRFVDKTIYVRLVSIPEELLAELPPDATRQFGDVRRYLNQWYSYKLESLEQYGFPLSPPANSSSERTAKEERLRKLAAKSDFYRVKSATRNETIGDAGVYHYLVDFITEHVLSFVSEANRILEDRNLTKEEEREVADFLEKLKSANIQLWIEKDDHYLRRSSVSISNFPYGGYNFPTEFNLELADFNTAQVIAPNAQPLENLLEQSLGTARVKSRDARRLADVRQIQLALELFADSHNQQYPSSDIYSTAACNGGTRCGLASPDACAISPLSPRPCMSAVPTDPSDSSHYLYSSMYLPASGRSFIVGYHVGGTLEEQSNSALATDRDCDSRSGSCGSLRSIDRAKGFNGSDLVGCRGETGRACYDVSN